MLLLKNSGAFPVGLLIKTNQLGLSLFDFSIEGHAVYRLVD